MVGLSLGFSKLLDAILSIVKELTMQRAHLSPNFVTVLWQLIEPYNLLLDTSCGMKREQTHVVVRTIARHRELLSDLRTNVVRLRFMARCS